MPTKLPAASLFKLTLPIFIDLLLVFSVTAVDAWFLSQISDAAAASVGAVLPLVGLGFTFFITLSYAGTSVASQRIGANDTGELAYTYGVLFELFLVLGLLVSAIFVLFSHQICNVLGMNPDMVEVAASYLSAIGMGVVFLALKYATTSILSSQQRTDLNMLSTVILAFANVFLNYVLVNGKFGIPALGAKGVALASCLSWFISLVFSLFVVYRGLQVKIIFPNTWQRIKQYSRPILNIAAPSVLEPLSWHLSQVVIIAMIVHMGEEVLATRVYANNILFMVAMFGTAVSAGVQIKVSHLVGSGDFSGASKELFLGVKMGLIGAVALVLLIYLISDFAFSIFTSNPSILELGRKIVLVAFLCEFGRSLNLVVGASLKAAGDAKFVAFYGISIMWLVSVPLVWLLGIHFSLGLVGVWLAMSIDELIRGTIATWRWSSQIWQSKCIYAVETKSNL